MKTANSGFLSLQSTTIRGGQSRASADSMERVTVPTLAPASIDLRNV